MEYIEPVERLIAEFTKLPGVGAKTAARYAYAVINMKETEVEEFATALVEVKKSVHYCPECGNYTDKEVCEICASRDKSVICVVEQPADVIALEKSKVFTGVYHVLHGVLNPKNNVSADDIRIKELMTRLVNVNEVIIATGSGIEGEVTASYIARLIKPLGIKVTRIARGLPCDSRLEYIDEVTLARAMDDRKTL